MNQANKPVNQSRTRRMQRKLASAENVWMDATENEKAMRRKLTMKRKQKREWRRGDRVNQSICALEDGDGTMK